jgi:hypothetical protein
MGIGVVATYEEGTSRKYQRAAPPDVVFTFVSPAAIFGVAEHPPEGRAATSAAGVATDDVGTGAFVEVVAWGAADFELLEHEARSTAVGKTTKRIDRTRMGHTRTHPRVRAREAN